MTDSDFAGRRRAAYARLDEVIAELHAILTEDSIEEHGDNAIVGDVPTDAVLLIGSQYYGDDGDRNGVVSVCPRGGSQPAYITAGLLSMALARATS